MNKIATSNNTSRDTRVPILLCRIFLIIIFSLLLFNLASRIGTPSVKPWRGISGGIIVGVISLFVLYFLSHPKRLIHPFFGILIGLFALIYPALASRVYPEMSVFSLLPFFVILLIFFVVVTYYLNHKCRITYFSPSLIISFVLLIFLSIYTFRFITTSSISWHNTSRYASLVCKENLTDINLSKLREFCTEIEIVDHWSKKMQGSCLRASSPDSQKSISLHRFSTYVGSCKYTNPIGAIYKAIDSTIPDTIMSKWYSIFVE